MFAPADDTRFDPVDPRNHRWPTPDLAAISPALLVPFEVVKLRKPSIAWINTRWFSDHGIAARTPHERQEIGHWLVDEFGFVVDRAEYSDQQLDRTERRTFHADRYGSNNGLVAHGGSGRSAAIGHFHVKGVGQTPLIGRGVNREHSHGAASLNVAIREAVYAEICDEEFPFGAVPVVAIIDTGLDFESSADPGRRLRRTLLIRPSVLRPSHMQRAAGFIDPLDGHINSQLDDTRRVREVIHHFVASSGGVESAAPALSFHFVCLGAQIAFGQVHRLYNGGFFSSNLSLDARLMDFGNMHALPNWVNAKVLDRDLGFGKEMKSLEATIRSLEFHFRKYAPEVAFDADATLAAAQLSYERSFARECSRALGLDGPDVHAGTRAKAIEALRTLFARQQTITSYYTRRGASRDGWPAAWLEPDDRTSADAQWSACYDGIHRETLSTMGKFDIGTRSEDLAMTSRRFLSPRRVLAREALQGAVDQMLGPAQAARSVTDIAHFIDSTVAWGRRHWPDVPADFIVQAHAYQAGHSVLEGKLSNDPGAAYWMEGTLHSGSAWLFDQQVSADHLLRAGATVVGHRWRLLVSGVQDGDRVIAVGGVSLQLPSMQVRYDRPD